MSTYTPDDLYMRLVKALVDPSPCPVTGKVTDNEIKIILGEIGDHWPESIRADVIAANDAQGEKISASGP